MKTRVRDRKGIGLKFPNPDAEVAPSGARAATQTNRETLAGASGRVLSSLLRTEPLESVRPEIGA